MIVVDDGSRDSSSAIASAYAEQDTRIRVVRQPNRGVAAARNRGFAESRPDAEFIVFLDHDDVWEPDALESLFGALERNPTAVGAHGLARYIDRVGKPIR